jgi:hypothetical protein
MKKENLIETLNIKILEQKEEYVERNINIWFVIDDRKFVLNTYKKRNGLYYPMAVFHAENTPCPFCHAKAGTCEELGETYINELFHFLINTTELRIKWIYIPHV